MPIVFSKEDNDGILFSYNDAIVISLNVENCDICRNLIDNRRSVMFGIMMLS